MFRISHSDAIELEHIVRCLYGCDRGGISGMCDADYFNNKPIQAAVLVVSYLYAKGLITNPFEYDEFLHNYGVIFDYPEENGAELEVKNYINELRDIVDMYIR